MCRGKSDYTTCFRDNAVAFAPHIREFLTRFRHIKLIESDYSLEYTRDNLNRRDA
jgi:hypothetical protein